jgi:hypothetical protein
LATTESSFVQGERASGILYNYLATLPQHHTETWIIPANCCVAVPLTFMKAGKKVIAADISPVTLCLDLEKINDLLKSAQVEGILFIETYGAETKPVELAEFKRLYPGIRIIFDKCLSQPDFNTPAETFSDLVLFSTGKSKQVDLGYGGFAYNLTALNISYKTIAYDPLQEKSTEEQAKEALIKPYPFSYEDTDWLNNGPIPLSFSEYKNKVLEEKERQHQLKALISSVYAEQLPRHIQLKEQFQQWRFNILVNEKGILLNTIFSSKLFAGSHYAPLHALSGNRNIEVTQKLHHAVINLFIDKYFTVEMAENISDLITQHCEKYPVESSIIDHFSPVLRN